MKKNTRKSHKSILQRRQARDNSYGTWEAVWKYDKMDKNLDTK